MPFLELLNRERAARGLPPMSPAAEAACRQEAGLQTRRAKQPGETPTERHARWRAEAVKLGVDVDALVASLGHAEPATVEAPDAGQLARRAVDLAGRDSILLAPSWALVRDLMTCDTAHVLASADVRRDALYVALTRGVENHLYVEGRTADCDRPDTPTDAAAEELRRSAWRDDPTSPAIMLDHGR